MSARRGLRDALLALEPAAAAVFGTAVARRLARRWRGRGCAVLCYHGVREPGRYDDPSVVVPPRRFAEQVAFLAEHADVVTVDDALAVPSGGGERPRVAITFDDGYRDLLDHALPALGRRGLPSTVFCCSDVAAGRRALWWDAIAAALDAAPAGSYDVPGLGRLDIDDAESRTVAFHRLRAHCSAAPEPLAESERVLAALPPGGMADDLYLRDGDMAAVERSGAAIGSHARSHARLSALDGGALAAELEDSRATLSQYANGPVRTIAYPYGDAASTPAAVRHAARAAGYELGFTGRTGMAVPTVDPLAVPRVPVGCGDSPRAFRGKALGAQPGLYALGARAVAS